MIDDNDPQGWCPFCAESPRHGCATLREAKRCSNYERPEPTADQEDDE